MKTPIMNRNKWTLTLAAAGLIGVPGGVARGEQMRVLNATAPEVTLSGYLDVSAMWVPAEPANTGGAFPNKLT